MKNFNQLVLALVAHLFFTSSIFAQAPANDDCSGALPIPCNGSITDDNTNATSDVLPGVSCGAGPAGTYHGVWFTITPTSSGATTVSTCVGTGWDTFLRVYSGTDCNNLTTCMGVNDDGCIPRSTLTFAAVAGTTYYILLGGYDNTEFGTYTISATCPLVNDECSGALDIPCDGSVSGDNTLASTDILPGVSCGAGPAGTYHGVWFTVAPIYSGDMTVSTCTGTGWDSMLRIYGGTDCNNLTTCMGANDDGCGSQSSLTFTAVGGTIYYVLLGGFGPANFGAYTISATCPAACVIPTSVASSTVTSTTANITWVCTSCVGSYELDYGSINHGAGTGTIISGISSPYTLTGLDPSMGYTVYVRQDCGGGLYSDWSAATNFTTAPANDDCAGAVAIPCFGFITGNNTYATTDVLPGSSCGAGPNGTYHGVWFTVTPTNSGSMNVSTCTGTSFDTMLRVYSGTDCNNLTTCLGNNDDACNHQSTVNFTAVAGTTYYILLAGFDNNAFGNYTINATCPTACFAPVGVSSSNVTTNSADISWNCLACLGTFEFDYGPAGHGAGTGNIIAGVTSTYTLTGLLSSTGYTVYLRQDCGAGEYSAWTSGLNFTTAPVNDDCAGAIEIPCFGSISGNNSGAYTDVLPNISCAAGPTGTYHGAWFTVTPINSGTMSVSTCTGTSFDTMLRVYSGTDCNNLTTCLGFNDDGCNPQSVVTFTAMAGTTYYVLLGGFDNSAFGTYTISATCPDYHCITTGQSTGCSPSFDRPQDNNTVSSNHYDQFSFTVNTSSTYDILATWTGFDGILFLYSPSFDPLSPNTNLLASADDYNGTTQSLINDIALTAGINYIVVGTTYLSDIAGGPMSFDIAGPGEINCPGTTEINGVANGPVGNVSTSAATADYECTDITGWTHYYDDNGTPVNYSDDNILLSIEKNGNSIGTAGVDLVCTIAGNGATHIVNPPANYVTNPNWYSMTRYWSVAPVNQPGSDVNVRFYFTASDFSSVQLAIMLAGGTPPASVSDLRFYKINGTYNPDPASGHNGIPAAGSYVEDGYWEYANGGAPSATNWMLGSHGNGNYAEYIVSSFSGGGGGSGGQGLGALPIELKYFNGKAKGEVNLFEWATASEQNSQYHIVEISANGSDGWHEVGRLDGAGTTNLEHRYHLADTNPPTMGYYRLKSIDFDGKYQYSNLIGIGREAQRFELANIFPVPSSNEVNLQVALPEASALTVTVTDLTGGTVAATKLDAEKGLNTLNLDISGLAPGSYFVHLNNGVSKLSGHIIKQ